MKINKQFENYKKYAVKEGVITVCRFFAKDDSDAELYKNKVRSKRVRNN
jgi:hypothetical protein|tara:strand:- start:395 stop:541 length:147 start_codon:yes stop_codon:yes gene_type:complete